MSCARRPLASAVLALALKMQISRDLAHATAASNFTIRLIEHAPAPFRPHPDREKLLTSLKFWRPLREERIGPFAKIGSPAAGRDCAAFVLHLRLKAALCAERQQLLGVPKGGRRSLGDTDGEIAHLIGELRRRKHSIDHAELLGFVR